MQRHEASKDIHHMIACRWYMYDQGCSNSVVNSVVKGEIKNPEALQPQGFSLVRPMGLEPIRLPTRPSNVRVCQFRHGRTANNTDRADQQLTL